MGIILLVMLLVFIIVALFVAYLVSKYTKKTYVFSFAFFLIVLPPFLYQGTIYILASNKLKSFCDAESGYYYITTISNGTVFFKNTLGSDDSNVWRLLAEGRHKRIVVDDGKKGSWIFHEPGVHEVYLKKRPHADCLMFDV